MFSKDEELAVIGEWLLRRHRLLLIVYCQRLAVYKTAGGVPSQKQGWLTARCLFNFCQLDELFGGL